MVAGGIDADLDALYAAAPRDFVRLRGDLAKRLRASGEREEAERVRALRKPTLVAWAANQLARSERREVERLLEAGDRLGQAQRALLRGGDSSAFEDARREQAEAVRRLVRAGEAMLEVQRGSASEALLDRLAETLRAASLDDDARELLRRGRLENEVEPSGFDALSGIAATSGKRAARPRRGDRRAKLAALRRAVEQARSRERALRAEARRLGRDAARARRSAETLEREAAGAEARTEEAVTAREAAERRLREARP